MTNRYIPSLSYNKRLLLKNIMFVISLLFNNFLVVLLESGISRLRLVCESSELQHEVDMKR
jgi:hypothetical protein